MILVVAGFGGTTATVVGRSHHIHITTTTLRLGRFREIVHVQRYISLRGGIGGISIKGQLFGRFPSPLFGFPEPGTAGAAAAATVVLAGRTATIGTHRRLARTTTATTGQTLHFLDRTATGSFASTGGAVTAGECRLFGLGGGG